MEFEKVVEVIEQHMDRRILERDHHFKHDNPKGVMECIQAADALAFLYRELTGKDFARFPEREKHDAFVYDRMPEDWKNPADRREDAALKQRKSSLKSSITAGVDTQKSGFEIRLRLLEIAEHIVTASGDLDADIRCGSDLVDAVTKIAGRLNAFVSDRHGAIGGTK